MDNLLAGKETIDAILSSEGSVSSSLNPNATITGGVSSSEEIGGSIGQQQAFSGELSESNGMELALVPRVTLSAELTLPESRAGGTNDYEELINKPKINSVTLIKDKSFEDLGLISLTNLDLEALLQ